MTASLHRKGRHIPEVKARWAAMTNRASPVVKANWSSGLRSAEVMAAGLVTRGTEVEAQWCSTGCGRPGHVDPLKAKALAA